MIDSLPPGEEVVLTRAGKRIAVLRTDAIPQREVRLGTMQGTVLYIDDDLDPQSARKAGQPVPGRGKGKLTIRSEDEDHLRDFDL